MVVVLCGSWIPNGSWWIQRCWIVSWWLWHQQLTLQQLVGSQVLDCLLVVLASRGSWIPNSSRNCNSRLIHRCWASWWLSQHVGVESPTAVGGFTDAWLLAGGRGNSRRNCNSWWIHRCWTVSWWLWHPLGVESPTTDLGHQFFFPPPGPQLVSLYFVLLLLAEVAGEQMAQPLPYPPTGGIRLTVQQDQSPGSHRIVHLLVEVAGEQTARPLPYPPTGGIRLTVQQDQSPGSHRLAEEWWK